MATTNGHRLFTRCSPDRSWLLTNGYSTELAAEEAPTYYRNATRALNPSSTPEAVVLPAHQYPPDH